MLLGHPEGGSNISVMIKTFWQASKNSDNSFNMDIYENFFFQFLKCVGENYSTYEKM